MNLPHFLHCTWIVEEPLLDGMQCQCGRTATLAKTAPCTHTKGTKQKQGWSMQKVKVGWDGSRLDMFIQSLVVTFPVMPSSSFMIVNACTDTRATQRCALVRLTFLSCQS